MAVLELINSGDEIGIRVDTNINFYKKSDVSVSSTDSYIIDFIVNDIIVASATPDEFLFPKEASLYDLMILIKGILSGDESLYVPYPTVRVTNTDGNTYNISAGGSFVCTPGTVPSGIAYKRPTLTGQLTSYRTGDDAWRLLNSEYVNTQPAYPVSYAQLDTTALDPFRTLLNNNAFGNKNRFTDENGLQVYGNNYAIDHLTNIGWYLTVQSAVTWNNAIDNSVAFTVLGYTDFYLPSIKEMESIVDVEDNDVLIYSPFNFSNAIGGVDLWTSTTNKGETTRAFIVQPLVSATQSYNVARTLKTSTEKHYIVRKHY